MPSFNQKIWRLIDKIPAGKVSTYKELARAAGSPNAFRAVGNACSANPNAPKTPCHRVVSSGGKIGGYAHGVERKIRLLASEGIRVADGKVTGFEERLFRYRTL
ncbi:MAG: MGMT family protein [Candidatus Diapherotrites archaeon]|uniref:methylated-DNA--[protein]-cysteine S-methyltransferase n=1 Tax=Candidatus Iainarchaeum sp. TaxID=3101447 RepID=A0A8T3YM12_9ARCH|nr:MGMT family protein [Candidatus Diapherotrites archaeon]